MTIASRGLKVKVIGQGQGHKSVCGRSDLDRRQFLFSFCCDCRHWRSKRIVFASCVKDSAALYVCADLWSKLELRGLRQWGVEVTRPSCLQLIHAPACKWHSQHCQLNLHMFTTRPRLAGYKHLTAQTSNACIVVQLVCRCNIILKLREFHGYLPTVSV